MQVLRLRREASRLAHRGRPWFYRDDLEQPPTVDGLALVEDEDGRNLGVGFASVGSRLVLRLAGAAPDWDSDDPSRRIAQFLDVRVESAIRRRSPALDRDRAMRIVHGETDGLPGLVVDRFGPVLVLQVASAFLEKELPALVKILQERLEPEMILARDDLSARRLEGLREGPPRLLQGRRIETVPFEEGGVIHTARPFEGHKTGFYLDQVPARRFVREHARGRRVLDLFAYQGAFSLHALRGGAAESLAVDESEAALEQARADAERNGLEGLETRAENAFQLLRSLRHDERQFDLVIVDPPAFAKARKHRGRALDGYRDLNRAALRLLAPGGLLVSCSCSHHVDGPSLESVVRQSAAGLPFRLALRHRLGAAADHPIWASLPETEYLKVLVYERFDL